MTSEGKPENMREEVLLRLTERVDVRIHEQITNQRTTFEETQQRFILPLDTELKALKPGPPNAAQRNDPFHISSDLATVPRSHSTDWTALAETEKPLGTKFRCQFNRHLCKNQLEKQRK